MNKAGGCQQRSRQTRWLIATTILSSLATVPVAAHAEGGWQQRLQELTIAPPSLPDPAPQMAQAANTARILNFNIPPQPLSSALLQYRQQSGIEVTIDPALIRGIASPGVDGSHTAEAALQRLLTGSGLAYQRTGISTISLSQAAGGGTGAINLNPVMVESQSQAETAWGPVDGYVAKHSATATKTDTPLIETPRSVTVITRDQVEAQGAQTLSQALRYTSGVTPEVYGSDTRADWFAIRGFDADLYWDGLRVPQIANRPGSYAAYRVEPYSLERIEVLKGPASILYGQGNLGGLINLVSKAPTADPIHELELTIGNNDRYQGAFDFGGALTENAELTYRFNALFRMAGTQVDNVSDNRVNISPSIAWQATEDTKLTIFANYLRDDTDSSSVFLPRAVTLDSNQFGRLPRSFNDGDKDFDHYYKHEYSAGYTLEHRFDDTWSAKQSFRYMNLDVDYRKIYGAGLQPDGHTLNRVAYLTKPEMEAIALDNHALADFSTGILEHKAVGGLDYQWKFFKNRAGNYSAITNPLDILDPDYHQSIADPAINSSTDQTMHQLGIYGQDQMRWGDIILVLGGRYDFTWARTENNINSTVQKQDPGRFTWSAGLLYETGIGLSPYISTATSFLPTLGIDADGNPLKPTTGTQYEAGVKYQPEGFDSFMTLSVYQLTQQNVTTSSPSRPTEIEQTGEIRSRGIELEGRASLTDGLDLLANFTYQDPEVTESLRPATQGKRPVALPKYMASLWADYTMPEGDFEGLGFGAGMRYIGSSYGDDTNTYKVSDRTLFDAALHYEIYGIRAAVNVDNILDKKYVASCSGGNCFYGDGRTVIGSLRYRW